MRSVFFCLKSSAVCSKIGITLIAERVITVIVINFESDRPFYQQVINQIVLEIALKNMEEGDTLPSVRQLAGEIGINMHTVNKAYSILKDEGYITLSRASGAVICVADSDEAERQAIKEEMRLLLARATLKDMSRADMHAWVDDIMDTYE